MDEEGYAIVYRNALVYEYPNDESRIIGRLMPGSQTILAVAQQLRSVGNGQYATVSFGHYKNNTLHGYVRASVLSFLQRNAFEAELARIQNMTERELEALPIFSDPQSMYQMPAPIEDVWLVSYIKNQRYNVYTAPDYHATTGYLAYQNVYINSRTKKPDGVYVSANEPVSLLGKDGQYVLIEYRAGKNNVGFRRGYIYGSKDGPAVSNEDIARTEQVPKANISAFVTKKTDMVDDTSLKNPSHTVRSLDEGIKVTILGFESSFGEDWAYCATRFEGYEARGYVNMKYIDLDVETNNIK
jgi:hypothetical protein